MPYIPTLYCAYIDTDRLMLVLLLILHFLAFSQITRASLL